jgi:hypothetical protein
MILISAEKPKSQAANKSPKMAEAVIAPFPIWGLRGKLPAASGLFSLRDGL